MPLIKTLSQTLKQDKEKFKVPKSVQQAIPIRKIWPDGIFQVESKYSRTFRFIDEHRQNWHLIQPTEQELQRLGEPVVHLHTVRNGKIDPALHDGMRTGLRQLHRHGQLSCRTAEITNCRRSNA